MKVLIIVFTVLVGLSIPGIVLADAPPLINYRGHFDGPPAVAGQPVSQSLVFSLYDSPTATEPLWTETQQVSIYDGNFAVLLGSVTPLAADLFTQPIRYIGVKTETGPELMRQQIISVPYAMRADVADMADRAVSALSAGIASQAESATTAANTNRVGNLTAAANGNIGINTTFSGHPLSLGQNLGDTKLALWENGNVFYGLGVQTAQFRFSVSDSSARYSFFDRCKPTFVDIFTRGKVDPNNRELQDATATVKPDQIKDPVVGFFIDPIEIFTIQGNGRVGIGIPNPQEALDVAGNVRASGIFYNSDLRLKKNIEPLSQSLENVLQLRGVEYDWKVDEFADRRFAEGKQIGLIAQEVEQVLPELVSTDRDDYKSVDYSRLVPVLVEAIKEQQMQIQNQQQQIQSLTAEVEAMKQAR